MTKSTNITAGPGPRPKRNKRLRMRHTKGLLTDDTSSINTITIDYDSSMDADAKVILFLRDRSGLDIGNSTIYHTFDDSQDDDFFSNPYDYNKEKSVTIESNIMLKFADGEQQFYPKELIREEMVDFPLNTFVITDFHNPTSPDFGPAHKGFKVISNIQDDDENFDIVSVSFIQNELLSMVSYPFQNNGSVTYNPGISETEDGVYLAVTKEKDLKPGVFVENVALEFLTNVSDYIYPLLLEGDESVSLVVSKTAEGNYTFA